MGREHGRESDRGRRDRETHEACCRMAREVNGSAPFSPPKSCNELSHWPAIGYSNEAFFRCRGWVCQHVVKRIRRCPVAVWVCVKKIRCMGFAHLLGWRLTWGDWAPTRIIASHPDSDSPGENVQSPLHDVKRINRVGGSITAPVLPHHRTYSSYPAVSVVVVTANTFPADSPSPEPGTKPDSSLLEQRGNVPSATSLCRMRPSSSTGSRGHPGRAGSQRSTWPVSVASNARSAVCGEPNCPAPSGCSWLSHGESRSPSRSGTN